MDDLLKSGKKQAPVWLDTEFNLIATITTSPDLNQLIENLKGVKGAADIAIKAVPALVRAFAMSALPVSRTVCCPPTSSAVCVELRMKDTGELANAL